MDQQATYVNGNIFVELGLGNLPDEQKLKLLDQMNVLIHKRTMLKIMENLNDEQKEHLINLEGISEEEKMNALVKLVPNLPDVLFEEVENVKNEMKAATIIEE